jgi:hypothetical protein
LSGPTAAGPAPRLAGVGPLRLAVAREDEASSGREQGGEQPGNKGKKQEAADAKC